MRSKKKRPPPAPTTNNKGGPMRSSETRQNEEQPIKRILAMMLDEEGACRAAAWGPSTEIDDIKKKARRLLAKYIEEKKVLHDPLAYHDYTMQIKVENAADDWEIVEMDFRKDVS
tara:strand:+ start:8734 stop:9078 length:345 start_codon:yes stop_codon:yes gene_type:complete